MIATVLAVGLAACGDDEAEQTTGAEQPAESQQPTPVKKSKAPTAPDGVVLAANCGNTSYLAYKPEMWSQGCTGGADNVRPAKWSSWESDAALGMGDAGLRFLCGSKDPGCEPTTYETRARVRLEAPRTCRDEKGRTRQYFSRARYRAYYGRNNPFGKPVGWHGRDYVAQRGLCSLAG